MRLIDADKFILALMDASLSSTDEDVILDLVDSIDTVPVVRCKDCAKSDVTEFGRRYCKEPMGMYGAIPVEDDSFCSYGKQKDGEGNG